MHELISILKGQHKTLCTLILHCSTLIDGRWSDLLSHLYDDLDSIRIPNIKTVYLCRDEDIDHNALEKAPDPELEGSQFIEARCRSLMEESEALMS